MKKALVACGLLSMRAISACRSGPVAGGSTASTDREMNEAIGPLAGPVIADTKGLTFSVQDPRLLSSQKQTERSLQSARTGDYRHPKHVRTSKASVMVMPRPLSDDWLYWDPKTIHMDPDPSTVHPPNSEAKDLLRTQSPAQTLSMELLRYLAASLAVGMVAAILLALVVMLFPVLARAAAPPAVGVGKVGGLTERLTLSAQTEATVCLGEVTRGSLLFKTKDTNLYRYAPTLTTDVNMRITGMIARISVSQRFHNPGDKWVEGVYVFPLPANAAVDHMRVQIGQRTIEGQIKERVEAKQIYTQARRRGKKAALIEQERPNIFTNSVANIGPSEAVTVAIEYQQAVSYDQGEFSIRFPMVVAPRYIPGAAEALPETVEETVREFNGTGWAMNTDRVPDAARITPPVVPPRKEGFNPDDLGRSTLNPVKIAVDLETGFPLARLASPYHPIRVGRNEGGHATVRLDAASVPADRDFVLVWQPVIGHEPKAALFTETGEGGTYALLMVMPAQAGRDRHLPREVIFVLDTSGSMGGTSIRQARQALEMAVERLQAGDSFNIIQFNSSTDRLFRLPRAADRHAREMAQDYIRSLGANGGTEMAPALRVALQGVVDPHRVRQVIFLTDGAVGNEAELFGIVKAWLGDSRLFIIGIGSAPNSFFLTKAARFVGRSASRVSAVKSNGVPASGSKPIIKRPASASSGLGTRSQR